MVKISVIIPVYNVEKYLKECLESVINQTFRDIEIICVNDGSTDKSLEILEEYEKKDSRINIISQINQGIGSARNTGINHAKGEYIYFADSDDYLNLTAFEQLNNKYLNKNPDFVMFKVENFYEETKEIIDDDYYSMPFLKQKVGQNHFKYDDIKEFAVDLCVCPYASIFNHEFIDEIRFPEGLLFEDNVFFTKALFKADKIYFYDEFLYHRRKHYNSTTTPISIKSLDTIEITNMLFDLCNEYGYHHEKKLYYRIFNNIYTIFKKADESQKEELFQKIKYDYLKNKNKWENDEYFNNKLNPRFKHIFNCAIKSRNASKFEKCVDNYSKDSKLKRLRKKLL